MRLNYNNIPSAKFAIKIYVEEAKMPTIKNLLINHDEDVRAIILTKWGINANVELAGQQLQPSIDTILQEGVIAEIIQSLPNEARRAFHALVDSEGKMPWSQFSRQYGDIRVMGIAKRERLHPEREPVSIAEILWYSGLIGRAFFDAKPEPREFVYIPEEICSLFNQPADTIQPLGKELVPPKGSSAKLAQDTIVDDICSMLAGLRMGMKIEVIQPLRGVFNHAQLSQLLWGMKLIDKKGTLNLDAVQEHLTKPRETAQFEILQTWLKNRTFIEMAYLPDLHFEGNLKVNTIQIRQRIIDLLDPIPPDTWWNLPAFIQDVKINNPEVLRVAGEIDTWYVSDRQSGALLRGFEHWDEVEGAFLHFFVSTILFGLGLSDLLVDRKSGEIYGFRWTDRKALLNNPPDHPIREDIGKFYTLAQANLCISAECARTLRYQVARFCEWKGLRRNEYQYQITPRSLQAAQQQGLQVPQLIGVLKKHLTQAPAPGLYQALQRFETKNVFANVTSQVLLRIGDNAVAKTLTQSDLKKYIIEELNPTTFIIDRKGIEHFQAKLTELGYLCQIDG